MIVTKCIACHERRAPGLWPIMLGAVLVLTVLAGACGSSSTPQARTSATVVPGGPREVANEKPVNGGTLAVGISVETDSWNPAASEWGLDGNLVGSTIFESLAKLNNKGGADPYLATSWIADSTFDKWQIQLRPGVTFQDGEPFNAAAVKQNFDAYVGGALSGELLRPLVKDVQVTGPLTVVVDLTQPWAAFPSSYLDSSGTAMMAPAMLNSPDHGATHPIGTGPFSFVSWQPGSSLTVKRNPHYWQAGLPHLDGITFKVIPDEATRAAALQSGDINMMLTYNADTANRLAPTYTVVKDWNSEAVSAQINTAPVINGVANPLSNIHARRALAYATNRATVAKLVGAGVSTADSPFPATSVWGLPAGQTGSIEYDPSKVKAEVEAYEQETGQPSLKITLTSEPDSDTLRLDQQLQAQWRTAGITASISTSDPISYEKSLVGGEYQVLILRNPNSPDPDFDYVFWSSKTIQGVGGLNINFSEYADAKIDQDLATGRTNGYPAQRKAAYDDMVHQINGAVLNVWLYRTPYSLITDHSVLGLNPGRDIAFGNYELKPWIGDLWLAGNHR
jgi:ABC-type transport system substrate-binding protein